MRKLSEIAKESFNESKIYMIGLMVLLITNSLAGGSKETEIGICIGFVSYFFINEFFDTNKK